MAKSAFHIAYKDIDPRTVTATTAISAGCVVSFAGAQISSAGVAALGIAKADAVIGNDIAVSVIGSCPAKVGASVAIGAALTPDASGRLVTATTGQIILARALQAAAAANDFIEVFITREGVAA